MTAQDFINHDRAGLVLALRDGKAVWAGEDADWRAYFELLGWELSLTPPSLI